MLSDSYGSLEWYRNLSEADKTYLANFGRDALIQKQKAETQQQEQQQEPEVEEQVEESIEEPEEFETEETETIEDPFFEQKQSQMEQKQRILDKIEGQLDREQSEDEVFRTILAVPEWRELLLDYVKSIQMLLDGWADYYVYSAQKVGDTIKKSYEFYKNNKLVTVDTTFVTSSGEKTVGEMIDEAEKKRQEKLAQFRHKGVATVEKGVD
jgi:hypothetical protein